LRTIIEKVGFHFTNSATSMSTLSQKETEDRDSWKTFIIPSSVIALGAGYFNGFSHIECIAFAPPARIRRISQGTFQYCTALKTIRIPASVEVLDDSSFVNPEAVQPISPIEEILFDPESRLHTICNHAFSGCLSLTSICLPASVSDLTGASFMWSGLRHISIEPGNRHFRIAGSFLSDFESRLLVRYFGTELNVEIPDQFDAIGELCFGDCQSFSTISFGPNSKLQRIEAAAFLHCVALESVSLPSSLVHLGEMCFIECTSLSTVTFGPNSQLAVIDNRAFEECSALISIYLPPSVKTMGHCAFASCKQLSTFRLPLDSKLARIERSAFARCSSLASFFVPSSVEFVSDLVFPKCRSLSTFTFGTPCRVRELLDLPPRWTGIHDIPDCVEMLGLKPTLELGTHSALMFGRDSSLRQVCTSSIMDLLQSPRPYRTFLQVSTPSLARFRSMLEFGSVD
jgi:hypothetical protein